MNEITVRFTPATIVANIDALKVELENRLAPFKGLVLSADQIAEGKKTVADLNKEKKVISARRLEVMRDHKAAADPFETGMKELEGMYDAATADMKAQITESETKRKLEVRDTLEAFLLKTWEASEVAQEYRNATIADLVTLTAITMKGNPTAKIAGEIKARVTGDRGLQDRTSMRLLKLENESYKAGLHAPLTRNHVESFLFAEDESYAIELDRIIAAEIERQKATEARIEQRQQQEAEAEQRRQAAAPQPEVTPEVAPEPVAEIEPVAAPVQAQPQTQGQAQQTEKRPVTIVCTFQTEVPALASEAQVERSIQKQLEAKGFTSLSTVKATFNPQQQNAA